ncbi:MAG: lytic murein transglycosylase [Bdellovibrionaceae bacterium]|nr:lytic murein transglycosylase [Pseudobdellovibrionaceae bacterium]
MRIVFGFLLLLLYTSPLFAALQGDWTYIEKRLKKARLESHFIKALRDSYVDKDMQTVIKLNVLLFLKKSNYHGVQVSGSASEGIDSFLSAHKDIFYETEKKFGGSKEVIASLLWIESRHGENYGNFHVPSAFLNLIQAERSDVLAFLQDNATDFNPTVTKKNRLEIIKRTKRKADWAMGELKALQTLYKKDAGKFKNLYGSFSGAFGMPQFLPSSYKSWAKTTRKNEAPDLFSADDAIYSVGFYLKSHGWKQKQKKSHMKALMKYNNSRDYAEAILKLAKMSEFNPSSR